MKYGMEVDVSPIVPSTSFQCLGWTLGPFCDFQNLAIQVEALIPIAQILECTRRAIG